MKKAAIFCYGSVAHPTQLKHYGGAIEILKKQNISAKLFGRHYLNKMTETVRDYADSHDVVLVVIHSTAKFYDKFLLEQFPNNVHCFGGIDIAKNIQYELFDKHNIPIAPWIFNPESWEEVFDKLGDKVVAKPLSSGGSRGVKYINQGDVSEHELSDRVVYCKDIRRKKPPYTQARANCIFGHCIYSISGYSNQAIPMKMSRATISTITANNVVTLGLRSHDIISHYYPNVAMTGSDVMIDENDYHILEINTHNAGMRVKDFDITIDADKKIARACMSKLKQLEKINE